MAKCKSRVVTDVDDYDRRIVLERVGGEILESPLATLLR